MKKLTKKEMAEEIITYHPEWTGIENIKISQLMKLTWDKLDTKLTALKIMNHKPINEEKKMNESNQLNGVVPEMIENYVIGAKDAKIWSSKTIKGWKEMPATESVAAVKGVKAVEAVKANKKKGIKAVKAVAEIKAVKAVEAKPAQKATPDLIKFHAIGNTIEICDQIIARLADMGYHEYLQNDGLKEQIDEVKFCAIYYIPVALNANFRKDYKLVKGAGKYNDPGLEKIKADLKAKKAAEKAENAEKEKARKAEMKAKEKEVDKDAPEDKDPAGDDDGWPGDDLDEE